MQDMIRQATRDSFRLITQVDHCLLAADLARHLGNALFASPLPYGPVIEAIAAHDAGWPLHDAQPTLNDQGQPRHVFEMPIAMALRIWSESARLAARHNDYSALLVSLHQLALSDIATQRQAIAPRRWTPHELFALNKFQHTQTHIQHDLRHRLGFATDIPVQFGLASVGASDAEDAIRYNFMLLSALDRISLVLCCGEVLFPRLDDLPTCPACSSVTLHLHRGDDDTLEIDPWPFDCPELSIPVPCRYIPAIHYQNDAAYHLAYHAAAPATALMTLRRRL